jgi:hypothetical protein
MLIVVAEIAWPTLTLEAVVDNEPSSLNVVVSAYGQTCLRFVNPTVYIDRACGCVRDCSGCYAYEVCASVPYLEFATS